MFFLLGVVLNVPPLRLISAGKSSEATGVLLAANDWEAPKSFFEEKMIGLSAAEEISPAPLPRLEKHLRVLP